MQKGRLCERMARLCTPLEPRDLTGNLEGQTRHLQLSPIGRGVDCLVVIFSLPSFLTFPTLPSLSRMGVGVLPLPLF